MLKRIDAISRVIYDPTGHTTGDFYPPNATHWHGKPIRRSARTGRANFVPATPLESAPAKAHLP
jgi:hypothetical protein